MRTMKKFLGTALILTVIIMVSLSASAADSLPNAYNGGYHTYGTLAGGIQAAFSYITVGSNPNLLNINPSASSAWVMMGGASSSGFFQSGWACDNGAVPVIPDGSVYYFFEAWDGGNSHVLICAAGGPTDLMEHKYRVVKSNGYCYGQVNNGDVIGSLQMNPICTRAYFSEEICSTTTPTNGYFGGKVTSKGKFRNNTVFYNGSDSINPKMTRLTSTYAGQSFSSSYFRVWDTRVQ